MCPVQNVIAPASAVPGRAAGATDFLDGWRGLAALEVVICHLFALTMASKLFAPPPGSSDVLSRAAFYILAAPFRFGVAAVWFFFVLSGFVIHLRYAKALRENPAAKFGWRKFVWHRLRRLYPPLLLAIGATWALVNLGTRMHLQFFDWGGAQWMPVLPSVFTCNLTLVGNLLFLMGCYMPAYGTDGSLWSLNREWWFYMLYPLLSPVLRLGKSPWLATAVVAGLYLFSFRINNPLLKLPKCIFHDMALWWLGALLAEIYAGRTRISFAQLAPLAMFIPIAMVFALLHQTGLSRSASLGQDGDIGQAMFGLGFAGLIATAFWVQRRYSWSPFAKLKWLGEMSYTLYVIHLPIATFVCAIVLRWLGPRAIWQRLATTPAILVLILVIAYFLHLFVERPFLAKSRRASLPQPIAAVADPRSLSE